MPEVTLIGILDADKEGFLRSETSLIQVIGRAARNSLGRVILYADRLTGSMERALGETNRRRKTQEDYNTKHGITPQTILKNVRDITNQITKERDRKMDNEIRSDLKMFEGNAKKLVNYKVSQMEDAVRELDFETAGILRDEIIMIENKFNLKPIMKGRKKT